MGDELRLYVVVRTDLEIPKGKLAVQVGHAFLGAYQECQEKNVVLADAYRITDLQTKVCLAAKNLHALERVMRECEEADINVHLVEDAGLTVFSEPMITALGLGPVTHDQLPRYVQRLRLLE